MRVCCLPAAASLQSQDKPAPSRKLKGRLQQCRRGLFPRRSLTVGQVRGDQEVGHLVTYPILAALNQIKPKHTAEGKGVAPVVAEAPLCQGWVPDRGILPSCCL
jgi:hypothetical protein